MASEYDSEFSELESQEKSVRNQTSSEILFTPQQREFRRNYRMVKSELCLKELWKLYNKLIARYETQEEDVYKPATEEEIVEDDYLDLTYVEDPTDERRYEFLAKKYKYLLDGIAYLIHCPEKPYLLTQKSQLLDVPERRIGLPTAIRNMRPDVLATTKPPFEGTTAYTKQWINVSNLNFEVVRPRVSGSSQTERADILRTEVITTRYRFFEGREILPIPTPYILTKVWDRSKLYCCQKYQELVENIVDIEGQLTEEKETNTMFIDVRPKFKTGPQAVSSLELEATETAAKKQWLPRTASTAAKLVKESLDKTMGMLRSQRIRERRHQAIDTLDLPWDPFETRYVKLAPFKNMTYDESLDHIYRHAQIVLVQTEMYNMANAFDDLGDLLSAIDKPSEQSVYEHKSGNR